MRFALILGCGTTAVSFSPANAAVFTDDLSRCLVAKAYDYAGIQAHAHAVASPSERVFGLSHERGSRPFTEVIATQQRADGTNVEGRSAQPQLPYAHISERVQRLEA